MKITFLGVGEAFDEDYTHTCILVEAAGRRMLVDCGATAPPSLCFPLTPHDIFCHHRL